MEKDKEIKLKETINNIINRISTALEIDWAEFAKSEIDIDEMLDIIADKIERLK